MVFRWADGAVRGSLKRVWWRCQRPALLVKTAVESEKADEHTGRILFDDFAP